MKKIILLPIFLAFSFNSLAANKDIVSLPSLVVVANSDSSLTVSNNSQAREEIYKTAGGVAVVGDESFENRFTLNLQDTLFLTPGVYTQKRFGEEVRISIRGSGLSRGFHMRGLELLQDGVPFNLADGSADFQEADSLAFQRLEVFKGANALKFGSATLGGAINMVSKTGKTHQGNQVRLEVGSFDTKRVNVQSGYDFKDSDAFISLTTTKSQGFREHSAQENVKLNSNFAKKISNNSETRFYLSANLIDQELPGSLSKENALQNAKMADASAVSADQKRDIRSLRFSNKTSFILENGGKVDFGAFVNLKDLFHPITPFVGVIDQETFDYGFFAQNSGFYNLLEKNNEYLLGLRTHAGKTDAKVFQNIGGKRGNLTANSNQISQNATIYGENRLFLSDNLSFTAGAQLGVAKRKEENKFLPQESDEKTYRFFNPKIGLLYKAQKNVDFFTNLSRSQEAPTFSELTQNGVVGFIPLEMQKAWTFEFGTRGNVDFAEWDLSFYRSWIKNEMLQYTVNPLVPAATFNAGDTIHQGIELGLNLKLAENIFAKNDSLKLNNSYTLSDYYFDKDRQFANNLIAGQPKHFLRSELNYKQNSWFFAPNLEVATSANVDFANTTKSPRYAILGFSAGYDLNEKISFFVDGRNILNENYIATFSTTVNGAGNVFYPGDGASIYAGIKIKL